MFNKLLSFFGYTLIKKTDYTKLSNDINDLSEKVCVLEKTYAEKVSLFEKPEINPTESFSDFQKRDLDKNYSPWNLYWKKYYEPFYLGYYLRTLSLEPKLIKEFMYKFASFNWLETEKYMKDVNWTWTDNKVSPNVKEMQECVLGLMFSCIESLKEKNESCVQTGGFEVKINKTEEGFEVTISFIKEHQSW